MMNPPPPPGQYSPDGQWWWNGQQWLPVSTHATPTAHYSVSTPGRNAFSRSFFGGLGGMSAGCLVACGVATVLVIILFAGCAVVLHGVQNGLPTPSYNVPFYNAYVPTP